MHRGSRAPLAAGSRMRPVGSGPGHAWTMAPRADGKHSHARRRTRTRPSAPRFARVPRATRPADTTGNFTRWAEANPDLHGELRSLPPQQSRFPKDLTVLAEARCGCARPFALHGWRMLSPTRAGRRTEHGWNVARTRGSPSHVGRCLSVAPACRGGTLHRAGRGGQGGVVMRTWPPAGCRPACRQQ